MRERERERARERTRACVCVCVCERERERERVCVCVCVCVCALTYTLMPPYYVIDLHVCGCKNDLVFFEKRSSAVFSNAKQPALHTFFFLSFFLKRNKSSGRKKLCDRMKRGSREKKTKRDNTISYRET